MVMVTGRLNLINLDDDTALDPAVCGGKAATLARLRRLDVRTPEGLVVPAATVAGATAGELAEAVDTEVQRRFGGGPVAIRSSAVGEDGHEASYAGMFTTVLGAKGGPAILEAINECVASASAAPVRTYRGGSPPALALLVQPMLEPQAAGVAFSADPVTGDRDLIRVSAVTGLGDRLVSGLADPDEWEVRNGSPARRPEAGEAAIDSRIAGMVAGITAGIAEDFDAPQDVEWALVDDEVVVLQARPITTLPVPPPPLEGEGWEKDIAHYPEPVTAYGGDLVARLSDRVMEDTFRHFGVLLDGFESKIVGGEVYSRPVMSKGGKPPPAPVLGILVRVVPQLRRKMAAAKKVVDSGLLEEGYPRRWDDEWRPRQLAAIERYLEVDLQSLDDRGLADHGEELEKFYGEGILIHFRLAIPYFVALHEWNAAAAELLGWDDARAIAALTGYSPASSAGGKELARLHSLVKSTPGAREALEACPGDPVGVLRAIDGELAAGMQQWLGFWGWRTLNDPGGPTLAERPGLLTRLLLAEHNEVPARPDDEALDRARAGLTASQRTRLDAALAFARRCYPQREDNVILTDNIPSGLLRRWLLEAGRRLVERGRLDRADDAEFLTAPELRAALGKTENDPGAISARSQDPVAGAHTPLVKTENDLGATVARRRGEWAWARLHPGPNRIGPADDAPPDLSHLPVAGRRINQAMIWAIGHEYPAEDQPAAAGDDALRGASGSAGSYEGPVRIIRGEADFSRLRPGDVLVCTVTTPAWAALFPLAGALVTDGGGVLSHAAIVAREHGIPAVLGTRSATSTLKDGQRVRVNGTAGTVTVME